jgi:hypothetical protein
MSLTHSTAFLLEQRRLQEIRERMAQQRAAREAAPPKRKRAEPEAASDWCGDVLSIVRRINKLYFTLAEVYEYLDELESKHPECMHIGAHVRHQLQRLRDDGVLFFHGRGAYQNLELESKLRSQRHVPR